MLSFLDKQKVNFSVENVKQVNAFSFTPKIINYDAFKGKMKDHNQKFSNQYEDPKKFFNDQLKGTTDVGLGRFNLVIAAAVMASEALQKK